MAVAYDNDADVTGNAVVSITTPAFTVSGSDRAATAQVMYIGTGLSSVSGLGVSWAEVAGTSVTDGSGRTTVIWRAIAPTTGSQTATATFTNADGNSLRLNVITWTGADQTTPAQNGTSATGASGTDPSVTVSSVTADDFVVDSTTHPNVTVGASQTERFNAGGFGAASTQDGADGGVMSWTRNEDLAWASAACRVVAATAGGPTETRYRVRNLRRVV